MLLLSQTDIAHFHLLSWRSFYNFKCLIQVPAVLEIKIWFNFPGLILIAVPWLVLLRTTSLTVSSVFPSPARGLELIFFWASSLPPPPSFFLALHSLHSDSSRPSKYSYYFSDWFSITLCLDASFKSFLRKLQHLDSKTFQIFLNKEPFQERKHATPIEAEAAASSCDFWKPCFLFIMRLIK